MLAFFMKNFQNKTRLFQQVLKMPGLPWLVWLSGLSADLWTEGSQVRFPVRAHA